MSSQLSDVCECGHHRDEHQTAEVAEYQVLADACKENYMGPGRYRHYKGGEYEVLGLAVVEASVDKFYVESVRLEKAQRVVIYRPLTPGSLLDGTEYAFWARSLDDFDAMVSTERGIVPRFVREDH